MALTNAIAKWKETIGEENIVVDSESLHAAERATFPTTQRIAAVIKPGNKRQVQECVAIANSELVPLYPISMGKNWGFGSRVPPQTNCVVMELSRLTEITDYNEALGYVTVQPGVTFRQINSFLRERGSRLAVSFTGSVETTSIVGNTIDGGVGLTRYGDRSANVCSLEVVLPDGQLIHTGLAGFKSAKAASLTRAAPGPELEGLFIQAGLGVVTEMTIWLHPVSDHVQRCYFGVEDTNGLGPLLEVISSLLHHNIFTPIVNVYNDYFFLPARQRQYPWKALKEQTPYPHAVLEAQKRMLGQDQWWSADWWGFSFIDAMSREHATALQQIIVSKLDSVTDRIVFMTTDGVRVAKWAGSADHSRVAANFGVVDPVETLLSPPPPNGNVPASYWRKKGPMPEIMDPDGDGCGHIFHIPIIPLTNSDSTECFNALAKIMRQYRFEPCLGLIVPSPRCGYVMAMLLYDRDNSEEDQRGAACYQAMLKHNIEQGYYPQRLPINAMPQLREWSENYEPLIDKIKKALDPNNICAPGRYGTRMWTDVDD